MSSEPKCPECGALLSSTAPRGLCSRCLILNSLTLGTHSTEETFEFRTLADLNLAFPDFEFRRFLGRGGMGAVYEAWQKSLGRPVALKILPPELMRSRDFFERFQLEARVMARLEHPNIARVYDSGITADEEAFIAMELINGEPVTSYIAAKSLPLSNRLQLFCDICAAVQHAHQKGVIHRDLKPSNILVTEVDGRPVPKVIDFGLAKPADQRERDEAEWLSARHCIGTPAYMSPEQLAGHDIDSRSDIYSLGVLLFELLTGRTPLDALDLKEEPSPASLQKSPPSAFPKPSTVLLDGVAGGPPIYWPPTSGIKVQGDLDSVVAKAIAPNPNSRYQTVAALPEEITRFLHDYPVQARKPTLPYVAGKLFQRHRVAILLSASFLIFLLVSLGLLIQESISTRRAERLAEEQLRKGERLIDFMIGDLHWKLQTVGRLDILESTVSQVESFYADFSVTNLSPESLNNRAHAKVQLGRIRMAQGNGETAQKHFEESVALFRAALKERPNNFVWLVELGQTLNTLAIYHHGREAVEEAGKAYDEALAIASRLVEASELNPDWVDFKASVLHNMASFNEMVGRLDKAETNYTAALHLWQRLQANTPDATQLIEHISHLYQNLAFLQARRGNPQRARESNAEALRLRERFLKLEPNNIRALDLLADIKQNISEVHSGANELVDAQKWLDEYLPIREQLAARDPSNTQWNNKLADAWNNAAVIKLKAGDSLASVEANRKSWETVEKLPESTRPAKSKKIWLNNLSSGADAYHDLAERAAARHDFEHARKYTESWLSTAARVASSSLTNSEARLKLARAALGLAAAYHNYTPTGGSSPHNDPKPFAHLALSLLERPLQNGQQVALDDGDWQVLRSLGLLPESATKNTFLTLSQARLARADLADKAFECKDIQWPDALVKAFRDER